MGHPLQEKATTQQTRKREEPGGKGNKLETNNQKNPDKTENELHTHHQKGKTNKNNHQITMENKFNPVLCYFMYFQST